MTSSMVVKDWVERGVRREERNKGPTERMSKKFKKRHR